MNFGFWKTLKKPIIALAPMADVTDAAFRRMIARYSRPFGPDVFWTEFVSADGLVRADQAGKQKLLKDLEYAESERPIVAQLFSGKPEMMREAAKMVLDLGFDGLDVNMGCPDRSIEKQGAGAALCRDPKRALEMLRAARQGVEDKIPISAKIRLGYNKDELDTLLPELLREEPATIIIHLRTRKEMSRVPAHWDRLRDAVAIRDELKSQTLIIGNGDMVDLTEARQKTIETGSDGVMLGQAIFGNPWLFNERLNFGKDVSLRQKLQVLVEHTNLFAELLPHKSFSIMKKHYKAYVSGWDGAKELRAKLMETSNAMEVKKLVQDFLSTSKF